MGKQLEAGTRSPMHPATAVLSIASTFAAPEDSSGDATWTTASCALTPVADPTHMTSPGTKNYISGGGGDEYVTLQPGQWAIEFSPLSHGDADQSYAFAICNGDGTTVHQESGDRVNNGTFYRSGRLVSLLHIPKGAATVDTQVSFRVLSRSAGQVQTVRDGQFGLIRKIGNANEV